MLSKSVITAVVLALLSSAVWIYGNSIEHNDMSNAGFQVFGSIGTVFFLTAAVLLFIVKRIIFRKKSS